MKKILLIFTFIIPLLLTSQNEETIDWITTHSIAIEDANPDSEMILFKQNTPTKFDNATLYGFGEASHNTKEFFDIKAKFFKHLVKNQGVKIFIMEESYQAEAGINEWISGGKGDIKTIAENFNVGFWYTKEIVNLLEWMQDYNVDKPREEQIRFYGMDVQIGEKINLEIREFITKNKISVDENLLTVIDSCANKKIDFSKAESWWQIQTPKLNELKEQLLNSKTNNNETKSIVRSLDYLISYTEYGSSIQQKYPKSTEFRDLKMFENVKYIVEYESKNGKAFIWAHNEHINKKEMYYTGSNIINLGRHLKDYYSDKYYSVGFDFGTGKINGYVTDKKKGNHWKTYHIEKPFRKTYANTLMSVDKDIYFVDLENALNNEPTNFFSEKSNHLVIGGGGYQPKPLHKILVSKIYTETYDGLIFVKSISIPDYKLN
ncbi:erythromycin esterase family protein [Flavobacterium azooxidireducens]|uniref:Erythromycin esterase family protein n=1 Tax=Flavobacterium azooxidireducens TaxID=1871076 RepID=A0ABY4KLH3_9FLAO|nr:erythromycin esterase family protein [Flavobacterium azooxidireducens]UPQ80260.1 erythromycin esterase family protein [Flavobacterium azooxidireducens]